MSLESNKADFEKALAEMQKSIELLEYCVDPAIMDTLNKVVDEYEGHLKGDIEEAEAKIEALEDQVVDHDSIVEFLNVKAEELQDIIDKA